MIGSATAIAMRNGHQAPKRGAAKSIASHKFVVTFFPSKYAPTKTSASLTASQLAERIRKESGKRKKLALPWAKLARFGNKISDNNCIRWDENVLALSGCEIDYDTGNLPFDTALTIMEKARIRVI
jgi:hypothetical protein